MEEILLNFGFSWTWCKMMPFIFYFLIGVTLFYSVSKRLTKRWVKYLSSILIVIPGLIYFIFNPIYEGDFSNNNRIFEIKSDLNDLNNDGLTLIAIPNCPYCKGALPLLKKIKERTSIDKINFVILSNDSSSIDKYKNGEFEGLNFKLSADSTKFLREISAGRFPAFCLIKEGQVTVWNNDSFGAPARDFVEAKLKK